MTTCHHSGTESRCSACRHLPALHLKTGGCTVCAIVHRRGRFTCRRTLDQALRRAL